MDNSFFVPPNSQFLSEDVIAEVVQRKGRVSIASTTRSTREESKRLKSKRQKDKAVPTPELMKTKEIEEMLTLGQELERERRRVNQARYQKRQNDRIQSLEKETEQLQQQIERLKQRRRVVASDIQPRGSIWSVAVEYFRLFGNPSDSAKRFLTSMMSFDVAFNSEYGVESILRSWRCLSSWFKDLEVELEAVKKTGPEAVVVFTTTSFTVTEDTVSRVFPHLANNSVLLSKLLGQRVSMQGWTLLQWDKTFHLVTRVDSQFDLLSPMLRLLETLENVSVACDQALVILDFQVRTDVRSVE
ncbi:hypothetical protein V7S43_017546 [Phytophthora oleae]|uniref:Bzip transcription factor n=1 Tax=Phytophthora oleae TaxID=2107226 RepID=A0ABD3EWU0_9STRA